MIAIIFQCALKISDKQLNSSIRGVQIICMEIDGVRRSCHTHKYIDENDNCTTAHIKVLSFCLFPICIFCIFSCWPGCIVFISCLLHSSSAGFTHCGWLIISLLHFPVLLCAKIEGWRGVRWRILLSFLCSALL